MKKVNTVTNGEFSKQDKLFRTCCELAGIEPTKRQVSKYRRGFGKASRFKAEGKIALSEKAES